MVDCVRAHHVLPLEAHRIEVGGTVVATVVKRTDATHQIVQLGLDLAEGLLPLNRGNQQRWGGGS